MSFTIVLMFLWVIVAIFNSIDARISETNRVHMINYFICWIALMAELSKDL